MKGLYSTISWLAVTATSSRVVCGRLTKQLPSFFVCLVFWGASAEIASAGTFTVYGKETITRSTGTPTTKSGSFSVLDRSARYEIHVTNGIGQDSKDKSSKVSSAQIAINGSTVVGPNSFNKNVNSVVKSVSLAANNQIEITPASQPGSYLVVEVIGYDDVPPEIKAFIEPVANQYGWHNGNVVVRFECSDKISGVASCPEPVTLPLEGANQVVNGTAVDVAGNSASTSVNVNIDLTDGLINGTITPAPNAAGWNNADTTVSFSCSDALSGVASCSEPQLLNVEGAQQSVTGTVIDKADNSASTQLTVNLDKTAPSITVTPTPQANVRGWHKGPVNLNYSCNDDLSGIASCAPEQLIETEGASQLYSGQAVDVADNSASTSISLHIDRTAPTITQTVAPSANSAGWHNSDVTVSYQCDDNLSGVLNCSDSQTLTTEAANQTVLGNVTDNADNQAETSVILNIDKTAPTITTTLEPVPNANGWHNGSVIVHFSCEDSLSGIASCPEPVTLTLEGEAQVVNGTAVDVAGNSASTSVNVNIDLTDGLINGTITPAPNAAGWNNADTTVSFSCSDALSGVASCSEPQLLNVEGAQQSVTGTIIDKADNSASTQLTVNLDKTVPIINVSPTPVANDLGWHNGPVQLDYSCNDALSGVSSCEQPSVIEKEGNAQVYTGHVSDVADNTSSTTITLNIDRTAPTIANTITPLANQAGWHNSDVTVSYQCDDTLSGVRSCSSSQVVSVEGAHQSITGEVVDNANNSATSSSVLNIDKTAPTISTTLEPVPNANGWHNGSVIVHFSCEDSLSGIASCPEPVTLTLEGEAQVVNGTAVDVAGNSASTSVNVNIDLTDGLINGTITPAPNESGWNNADTTVSFSCSDALSGVASCSEPQLLNGEGAQQSVTGTVVDKAGNSASETINLNIDLTAPNIAATILPTPNELGWNNKPVEVSFTCDDGLSGIARCEEPALLQQEGKGQSVSGEAIDNAGNSSSTDVNINIDLTSGTITGQVTPAPNAAGWNNSDVSVSFSCSDALSGVASCSDTQAVLQEGGQQNVVGTVIDNAGNSATTQLNIKLDKTAPQITASIEPAPNAAGWNSDTVVVNFSCSDSLSGIAVCPAPVTVELEGENQLVSGTAVDVAGNEASTTIGVNIDRTAAIINATITPEPNGAGWNNADTTITFTCSDALSGVETCSDAQSLAQEGEGQTITGVVTDKAGNQSEATVTVNLDKTAPVVSFINPAKDSAQTENPPPLTISVSDNLKLNEASLSIRVNNADVSANCQIANGQASCTLPAYIEGNAATIEARIEDMAGNASSASVTFNFDNDGDGYIDAEDLFPQDASEWADLDSDGVGDNSDPDRDGDGISNDYEVQAGFDPNDATVTPPDADGDAIPDSLDSDRDGDGVANDADVFPDDASESSDLDGDGIGDNSDPDRDGDGYSNSDEEAAGTNPNLASDYPDNEPPVITLDGSQERTTDIDTLSLAGTAVDSGKGVAGIKVVSDQYAGVDFAAILSGDNWTASIPLEVGTNLLTVIATDNNGNSSSLNVSVLREDANAVLGLTINYPEQNAILTTDVIVVRGVLRSSKPALEMNVQVNGTDAPLSETDSLTEFTFQSSEVTLAEGINTILVKAVVDGQPIQRSVYVKYQTEVEEIPAPVINVFSPQNGGYLAENDFVLAGELVAEGKLIELTVNGQPSSFNSNTAPQYAFRELLSIPQGSDGGLYTIIAKDELGQSSELVVEFFIDKTPPVISLERPLNVAPADNTVVEQPYHLRGTVSEPNLSSVLINDSSVSLEPLDDVGNYHFDVPLSLQSGSGNSILLSATDMAGNRTSEEYLFTLDTDITLELLSPQQDAEYFHQGTPVAVVVNVQVNGQLGQGGVTIIAKAVNGAGENTTEVQLSGTETLQTGSLELPALAGDYRIIVTATDSSDTEVAVTTTDIQVVDAQTIPLEVTRVEPNNAVTGIEPNEPIAVYFNQPLDTSKVAIKVYETAHGYTYVDQDEPGTDALSAKGYQLVEVHHDHEAVEGGLSLLPNNRTLLFYPNTTLAYNATIYVDVEYDGTPLSRTLYYTRPLPTFIVGTVFDQLGQAAGGIEVTLPGLGRTTYTNDEGAYTFGFGDSADENIPGGSYQLLINDGMKNRRYGTLSNQISVLGGRLNNLKRNILPQLAKDVPFVPVRGGEQLSLLNGALKVDLTQAQTRFTNGMPSGDVHAQFMSFSQIPYDIDPLAMPLWMYSIQPSGMRIDGTIGLDFACPQMNGNYDYVPANGNYVLLLGLNPTSKTIAPVGVGQVDNYRIKSVGPEHYETIEMIGFGYVADEQQQHLQAYAQGQMSLPALLIELRN